MPTLLSLQVLPFDHFTYLLFPKVFRRLSLIPHIICPVIPYPYKSGGIYPLSLKVPRLLSLKVLPLDYFTHLLFPKVFRRLSLIPHIICSVIPYPSHIIYPVIPYPSHIICPVIPHPYKSGVIYPLSLKVLLTQLSLIGILIPKTPNRASKEERKPLGPE